VATPILADRGREQEVGAAKPLSRHARRMHDHNLVMINITAPSTTQ
jgi:hypothetical protein